MAEQDALDRFVTVASWPNSQMGYDEWDNLRTAARSQLRRMRALVALADEHARHLRIYRSGAHESSWLRRYEAALTPEKEKT